MKIDTLSTSPLPRDPPGTPIPLTEDANGYDLVRCEACRQLNLCLPVFRSEKIGVLCSPCYAAKAVISAEILRRKNCEAFIGPFRSDIWTKIETLDKPHKNVSWERYNCAERAIADVAGKTVRRMEQRAFVENALRGDCVDALVFALDSWGFDVNDGLGSDNAPLLEACRWHATRCVAVLMERKAKMQGSWSGGRTLLHELVDNADVDGTLLATLIAALPHAVTQADEDGKTPIVNLLGHFGNGEALDVLLAAGATLHLKTHDGESVFHHILSTAMFDKVLRLPEATLGPLDSFVDPSLSAARQAIRTVPSSKVLLDVVLMRAPALRATLADTDTDRYAGLSSALSDAASISDAGVAARLMQIVLAADNGSLRNKFDHVWYAVAEAVQVDLVANAEFLLKDVRQHKGEDVVKQMILGHVGKDQETLLHKAADPAANLEWVLAQSPDVDVNALNAEGETPLMCLAHCWKRSGNGQRVVDLARLLVSKGAVLDVKNKEGNTLLHLTRHEELLALFLSDDPQLGQGKAGSVHDVNHSDETPLHTQDDLPCMQQLIAAGADVNAKKEDGKTKLFAVIGNAEETALLLNAGADPSIRDDDGNTVLFETYRSEIEGTRVLFEMAADGGAGAWTINNKGKSPLHVATDWSNVTQLTLLLAQPFVDTKTEVNRAANNGETPLMFAAGDSDDNTAEVVAILLAAGADVHAKTDYKQTALHKAFAKDSLDNVKALLNAGADLAAKDDDGHTPPQCWEGCKSWSPDLLSFMIADDRFDVAKLVNIHGETLLHHARTRNLDTIDMLVAAGCDVNAKSSGWRAEPVVFKWVDTPGAVERLVSHGAVLTSLGRDKETLIHRLCQESTATIEQIQFLVDRGIKIDAVDENGRTCLFNAMACGAPLLSALVAAFPTLSVDIVDEEGNTLLHEAAERSLGLVQLLLGNEMRGCPVPVDPKNNKGQTPLHVALGSYDMLSVVELLLQRGADVKAVDEDGKTALSIASDQDDGRLLSLILAQSPDDINTPDAEGKTPLINAVASGQPAATLDALVASGADLTHRDEEGNTLLHLAAKEGKEAVVQWLAVSHAALFDEWMTETNEAGMTPLMAIADGWSPNIKVAEFLASKGADVNAVDEDGDTMVHKACGWGYKWAFLSLLIDIGADLTAKNDAGETPLFLLAADEDRFDGFERVFAMIGGDVTATNNDGRTLLHIAAYACAIPTCTFLLENGADVNAKDHGGRTPLFLALNSRSASGKCEAIYALLAEEYKADLSIANDDNESLMYPAISRNVPTSVLDKLWSATEVARDADKCLFWAADNGHVSLVPYLIERGANVDAVVKDRWSKKSALMASVSQWDEENAVEVTEALLAAGAQPNVVEKEDGTTAIFHVKHKAVALLLINAGADLSVLSKKSETVLFNAARNNELDCFKELVDRGLSSGVDLNHVSKDDESALELAADDSDACLEKVQYLLDNGASPIVVNRQGKPKKDFKATMEVTELLLAKKMQMKL